MIRCFWLFCFSLFTLTLSAQDTLDHTIQHNEDFREYRVYVPSIYNENEAPVSLIIALHGLTNTGPILFESSKLNLVADTANFISVFPTALTNLTGVTGWNNGLVTGSSADDISFLSALIDTLMQDYNIDPNKIFFTGFSMGGFMSNRLACELPERVAAIASCSGTFSSNILPICFPGRAMPMMHIHGTGDYVVDYNGNWLAGIESVETTMDFWKVNNSCSDTTLLVDLPDLYEDGITVQQSLYVGCEEEIQLFTAFEFWHEWMQPEYDIFASAEIWKFFRRQSLPAPVVAIDELPLSKFKVSPNPANYSIRIESSDLLGNMTISDILGHIHYQAKENSRSLEVDISNWPQGMYIIHRGHQKMKFIKKGF